MPADRSFGSSSVRLLLRTLSVLYALGAFLHLLDVLDLRLRLSGMAPYWKVWIWYLLLADVITAIGLWKLKNWGVAAFQLVAFSQLIAYTLFQKQFGNQWALVVFHCATLLIYFTVCFLGEGDSLSAEEQMKTKGAKANP